MYVLILIFVTLECQGFSSLAWAVLLTLENLFFPCVGIALQTKFLSLLMTKNVLTAEGRGILFILSL